MKPAAAGEVAASTATVVAGVTETHTVAVDEASGAVAVLHGHHLRPGEALAIITARPPVGATHTCLETDVLRDDDHPRRTHHRLVLAPAHPVRPIVADYGDATPRLRMCAGGRGLHCPARTITALVGAPRPQTGIRLRQNADVTPRLEVAHLSGGGAADQSRHLARTDGLCHVHEAHLAGHAIGTAGAEAALLAAVVGPSAEEDAS